MRFQDVYSCVYYYYTRTRGSMTMILITTDRAQMITDVVVKKERCIEDE